ncbi:unnamed protein product, partial [Notodromas monacha]
MTNYYGIGLDAEPDPRVTELTDEQVLKEGVALHLKPHLAKCTTVVIPEYTPVDIRTKLIVAFVHLEAYALADIVVQPLITGGPQDVDDLYVDIYEAYMAKKMYKNALVFLEKLAADHRYCTTKVLLSYAECLLQCGDMRGAETAYKRVLEQLPDHVDARLSLSRILNELGETGEALDFITQ